MMIQNELKWRTRDLYTNSNLFGTEGIAVLVGLVRFNASSITLWISDSNIKANG